MKPSHRLLISSVFIFVALLALGAPFYAAAQSVTFAPAEKAIILPSNIGPFGNIAVDSAGNLFFPIINANSPFQLNTVGKLSASGVLTTSTPLPSGDSVAYVKIDSSGNLYVENNSTGQLVRITPAGASSVVATNNVFFDNDFAADGSGNVYAINPSSSDVLKFTAAGASSTFASGFVPGGITVDSSANIYISDDTNNRIVKISSAGTQTVVATGLNNPGNLVLDSSGNIYVVNFVVSNANSNAEDAEILKISTSGAMTKIFDGCAFSRDLVQDVAVDGKGNVYAGLALLESNFGNSIVEIQNTTVATGAINFGGNFSALWYTEGGLTAVKPVQPVTFTFNASVTVGSISVLTNGAAGQDFQSASGGTCTAKTYTAGQTCTVNVQFSPTQAGTRLGALMLLGSSGNILSQVNLEGLGDQEAIALDPGVSSAVAATGLKDPSAVAVDGSGNTYIVDKGNNRVVKLTSSGTQTAIGSGFSSPTGVAEDGAGNLYVSDTANDRVEKITPNGTQTTVGFTGLSTPDGVAVDGAGNVYVADSGNDRVVKLSANGSTQTTIGSGFSRPTGVAIDGQGNVLVADFGNSQIVKVAPAGTQATIASGLAGPSGVTVDAAGNLYIAEVSSNDVVMVSPSGGQTTIASGLNFPFDAVLVAVNSSGNVFIANTLNNQVLQINRTQATMAFGTVAVGGTSSSQTVTLTEIGLFGFDNSPFPTLSDSTDFQQQINQDNDCGNSYVNGQCNITITFTPQKKGALSGTGTINDTPSEGTQTIKLSGTGQ